MSQCEGKATSLGEGKFSNLAEEQANLIIRADLGDRTRARNVDWKYSEESEKKMKYVLKMRNW
jgi:hypothetical protein